MNLTEVMREIEGYRLAAMLNVASDLNTFLKAAEMQPEVQALLKMTGSSSVTAVSLAGRCARLAAKPAEPGFAHPDDTAIAVYLWVLSNHAWWRQWAEAFASDDRLHGPSFWWARQIAERVGKHRPSSRKSAPARDVILTPYPEVTYGGRAGYSPPGAAGTEPPRRDSRTAMAPTGPEPPVSEPEQDVVPEPELSSPSGAPAEVQVGTPVVEFDFGSEAEPERWGALEFVEGAR